MSSRKELIMSIDMYQQIVRQVQQLTPDEQLKLMQELIEMQLLDQQIAEKASYLRATCTLRTLDVIQLATALYSQADFFLPTISSYQQ
jgi:hypothetical protein